MDHIDPMLERNSDDIILCEVGSDGSEAFANLVCLVGLAAAARGCIVIS